MISDDVSPSSSDLLHSVQQSPGPEKTIFILTIFMYDETEVETGWLLDQSHDLLVENQSS